MSCAVNEFSIYSGVKQKKKQNYRNTTSSNTVYVRFKKIDQPTNTSIFLLKIKQIKVASQKRNKRTGQKQNKGAGQKQYKGAGQKENKGAGQNKIKGLAKKNQGIRSKTK